MQCLKNTFSSKIKRISQSSDTIGHEKLHFVGCSVADVERAVWEGVHKRDERLATARTVRQGRLKDSDLLTMDSGGRRYRVSVLGGANISKNCHFHSKNLLSYYG
jgi:hypothetical protein